MRESASSKFWLGEKEIINKTLLNLHQYEANMWIRVRERERERE
jgi:hypothetical protein